MNNTRMILDNLVRTSTLALSAAPAGTLGVDNLKDSRRSRVLRTQDTGSHSITGTFDGTGKQLVSGVVLWRHNLTESATWRIRLYAQDGQAGTPVYDSGSIPVVDPKGYGDLVYGIEQYGATMFTTGGDARFGVDWFAIVSARSFQIDIEDAANPDGYLQVDRLIVGYAFESLVNHDWGSALQYKDDSRQNRMGGGSLNVEVKEQYRVLTFSHSWLSDSEATRLTELFRRAGTRNDAFVSLYPELNGERERNHAFVGLFKQVPATSPLRQNTNRTRYQIEES